LPMMSSLLVFIVLLLFFRFLDYRALLALLVCLAITDYAKYSLIAQF